MSTTLHFEQLVSESIRYLEHNRKCRKHHVEHTGSNTYLLDFYSYTGQLEKGRELVSYLLSLITKDGSSWVFYPGRLNQMNMANSVIDTGSAVDTIARFMHVHADFFSDHEHALVRGKLKEVVDSYLQYAATDKPISNQRLWGVTGLASYARYVGDRACTDRIRQSIERAFADMTVDGFFRYYPDATAHGAFGGYDEISAFYQSRHVAFMRYALEALGESTALYEADLEKAERALLSMYTADGYKDMRLDCKRWYWLGEYEVASHAFDAYALAFSRVSQASVALQNVLYGIRTHFTPQGLRSHKGMNLDFQCSIFWTAHLAWLTRVPDIDRLFAASHTPVPFTYTLAGEEVVTHTEPGFRLLLNMRNRVRNQTVGLLSNGLPVAKGRWRATMPALPPAWRFSVRESLNHAWYALRGGRVLECGARLLHMGVELVVMLLPYYREAYGRIKEYRCMRIDGSPVLEIEVLPEAKYGTAARRPARTVYLDIPEALYHALT
ncbi:MAG TPA: hypothetical protein VNU25_03860 [Candidatus Paceibacterota bacterium]|nr:hypothetical protein [Candidatus Paceibacterota bacterium]